MKVLNLKLRNYRCFDEFEIQFAEEIPQSICPNIHVLLAPNMVGKSAVLKALRLALASRLQKINNKAAPSTAISIGRHEHRVLGNNPFSDLAPDVEIKIEVQSTEWSERHKQWRTGKFEWSKYKISAQDSHTRTKPSKRNIAHQAFESYKHLIEHKDASLPLLLYIGTEYIHQAKAETNQLKVDGDRIQGYLHCLDDRSMEKYVFNWLRTLHDTWLEQQRTTESAQFYGDLPIHTLNAFRQALKQVVPGLENVTWVKDTLGKKKAEYFEVFNLGKDGLRTYEMLSDGYRYLVLLVGEIVTRATLLNKHLGEQIAQQLEGVVIIDELGIHLHPELQGEILWRLSQAFPKLQFIISTHSPMMVNGLRKEQIHLIYQDEQDGKRKTKHPEEDVIGLGAERILLDVFGLTSTYDRLILDKQERYKALQLTRLNQNLNPEEEAEWESLSQDFAKLRFDDSLANPLLNRIRQELETELRSRNQVQEPARDLEALQEDIRHVVQKLLNTGAL